jgi:uncharacterized membrane protein
MRHTPVVAEGRIMSKGDHLWAIGYDTTGRAEEVRAEIARLGERRCLVLLETAVAVRYHDGSVTLDGEPFVAAPKLRSHSLASLLAALALGAPPLTCATAGAWARATGGASCNVGIDQDFLMEVEAMMRSGTSTLFVLDQEGDMDAILQGIRGLGGTVLKSNVNVERARLIQSTLAAADTSSTTTTSGPEDRR